MSHLRAFVVYLWAAIVMGLGYPFLAIANRRRGRGDFLSARRLVHRIAHPFAKSICFLAGARLSVEGLEHVPEEGPVLLIGNHQSYFDVPVLLAALPRPIGFVAKDDLAKVPLLAPWTLGLPSVFIPRGETRKALETVLEAAQLVKNEAHALVLFPEGTRTDTGAVAPYKAGGFKIGTRSEAAIVPFVIQGNYELMPRPRLVFRPGPVKVVFFPPLEGGKRADTGALAEESHRLAATYLDTH